MSADGHIIICVEGGTVIVWAELLSPALNLHFCLPACAFTRIWDAKDAKRGL